MIVVLWRAGLRIQETLALAEHDLDQRRGSLLVRNGKGGRRREAGMDDWGWEQVRPWLNARAGTGAGCSLRARSDRESRCGSDGSGGAVRGLGRAFALPYLLHPRYWQEMLQNVEIVRTLLTSLDRDADRPWPSADSHEFDRLLRLDLFDADVDLRQPARFPVGQEFHGHQGLRQWAAEIWEVFSEVRQEVDEVIEAGDGETLVSAVRSWVRMRQTGLEFELRWATVWTIRGGKVQRAHSYATKAEALEAAGPASGDEPRGASRESESRRRQRRL